MTAALSLTPETLEELATLIASKLRAPRQRPRKTAKAITDLDRARAAKVAAAHGLLAGTRKVTR